MAEPNEQPTVTQTGSRKPGSVTPQRFAQIRAIFEASLERPAGEWKAYVAGACGGDSELEKEVLAMLAADDAAGPTELLNHPVSPGSAPPSSHPSSAPDEGRFPAGTVLVGRYRILGMLGKGGMGEVYRAFDLILNQTVALKFLSDTHFSDAALVRFRNEVRIARQVSHPNVCRVYDLGMAEGMHFLSMEYIDGEDLASLLRRIGRLPQDKAIEFTRKICAGLGAAHDRGVLHRDLKPANIMIDGRGQPRLTDFGLAGLAEEIPLSDLRSGTPAYMSPEQKAGKEVTVRSDIYSLGLVMHEMFLGQKRDKESQTSPTDIVKDLDPAIERLILRCLEEEPSRRPASALRVAMSLPGGDPIAAALAAGETPSPEMVAASQEKEGFQPLTAVLCFAGIVVCLLLGIFFAQRIGFLAHTPLPLAPDVLADRAQQFLATIGYTTSPADTAWSLSCCDRSNEDNLKKMDAATRDKVLASHRPPVIHFWYRQSLQPFGAGDGAYGRPTETSPPNSEPGMILVDLDATGRLLSLQVEPWTDQPAQSAVPWSDFFDAAGLDFSRFHAVTPSGVPPMAIDEQFAWQGPDGDRAEPVTIQAASWRGRPVLFETREVVGATPQGVPLSVGLTVLGILGLVISIAGWRVWRSGRLDRRGAVVLTSSVVVAAIAGGSAPTIFLLAGLIGLVYASIEPFARRYWPDSLISWSRVCQGQWRNPLVASHVLVAILAGAAASYVVFPWINWLISPLPSNANGEAALPNIGSIPFLMANVSLGVFSATMYLTMVILARLAFRRLWVADFLAAVGLVAVSFYALYYVAPDQRIWIGALLVIPSLVWIVMMRHFGFLTLLVIWIAFVEMGIVPLKISGWGAERVIALHMIPIAVAAWCLWVILSARSRMPDGEV